MTLVMGHINLYLYNPYQTSPSYPFSNIDASVNAERRRGALVSGACENLKNYALHKSDSNQGSDCINHSVVTVISIFKFLVP